jgi:FkbM family methyltransferase
MHIGRDSEFYLLKGFDVLAIEANPALAAENSHKFREHIEAGRLTILNVAVADHDGEVEFFAFDQHNDWGTISPEFRSRNEALGLSAKSIKVPAARLESILRNRPAPYYVKIDIEGADLVCLSALGRLPQPPKYVSIEPSLTSYKQAMLEFETLQRLGYTKFKVVNQALHASVKLPNPAKEGEYASFAFDGYCTGPFGEEIAGDWLSYGQAKRVYGRILAEQRFFGGGASLYGTRIHRLYERLRREPVGWYDVHATR